jgi:predicted PurR-regulated permease PerM
MQPPDNSSDSFLERRVLLMLLVVVSLALGWILLPFYGAILWGFIIALLFAPVYAWLLPRLRFKRTPAALLTMLIIFVLVVLPFALIVVSIAHEAALVYQRVQTGELNPSLYLQGVFNALPSWVTALLDRFGLANFGALQDRLGTLLAEASKFLATQALSVGQITFHFIANLFITLYLAFFLIRDGDSIVRALQHGVPLAPAHKKALGEKFTTAVRATVKGNFLVAALQGSLGGLAFWALGIGAPVLWAVLMAFLSLLPAVGSGLVWVPVAVYLLVNGSVGASMALCAWGVLVMGLVDNFLRPMLVGKDTRMPDYVVLITTLGGMAALGLNGFVLGPTLAAMFAAVWQLHVSTRAVANSSL